MAQVAALLISAPGGGAAVRAQVADTWPARLAGLLPRDRLADGEGLLLRPCCSVHTLGMSFPIDILFLNEQGMVMAVTAAARPWRLCPAPRGTAQVLELAAGAAGRRGWAPGTRLHLQPVPR